MASIPTPPPALSDVDAALDALDLYIGLTAEVPVLNILDILAIIADIVLQLVPLQGKPRALDTLTIAQRYMASKNIAVSLWGTEIYRLYQDHGIVLSSSDPADTLLIAHNNTQLNWNLQLQGFTPTQATAIVNGFLAEGAQYTGPIGHGLGQPAPQGFSLWGPDNINQEFATKVTAYQKAGETLLQAQRSAARWLFSQGNLNELWYITFQKGAPTQVIPYKDPPPLPKPAPQPTPTPVPPPPPPPPPNGIPSPCFPTPSPGLGDELTDAGQCVAENLAVIASWMPYLVSQQGGPTGGQQGEMDACCTAIVAALTAIQNSFTSINVAPVINFDVTPIVTALNAIQAAIAGEPSTGLDPCCTAILAALEPVVADLAAVVAQLTRSANADTDANNRAQLVNVNLTAVADDIATKWSQVGSQF